MKQAEKFQSTDALRRELAELKNQADTLLYTTEQALEGYADLLDPSVVRAVSEDITSLRHLMDGGAEIGAIRDAYTRLEGAAFRIAESMYEGTEGGGEPA